jgi:hypothetical protein
MMRHHLEVVSMASHPQPAEAPMTTSPATIPWVQRSPVKETNSEREQGAEEVTQKETPYQMKHPVWPTRVGAVVVVVSSLLYSSPTTMMQNADD